VGQFAVNYAGRNVPEKFLFAQRDALHLVEGAQDFFVRLHAQGAEEDGAEELALAVDTHVENVLGVVLEFNPGAAIGNDLAEEIGAIVGALEKDTGERCNWLTMTRSVPLMMKVPLSVISGISP